MFSINTDADTHRRLDEMFDYHLNDTVVDGVQWYRRGYKLEWRHVAPFLTEAAAQHYINTKSHRHSGKLRIYASSAHANPEMRAVREYLMEAGK